MSEACLALGLPVIGGNVSLYNESFGVDIDPTPVIGVLGLIDRLAARPPGVTLVDGASLVLLDASVGVSAGRPESTVAGRLAVGRRAPGPPQRHPARPRPGRSPAPGGVRHRTGRRGSVRRWLDGRWRPTSEGSDPGAGDPLVSGVHDVSGGGLGVALAELAVRSGIGLQVAGVADHHELFTEAPSRVVVCTTRRNELISRAAEAGVGFRVLGTAGGQRLVVEGLVDVGVDELTAAWRGRLPSLLDDAAPVLS